MNNQHPGILGTGAGVRPRKGLLGRIETLTPLLVFPVIIYTVVALLAGDSVGESGPAILGPLNSTLFSLSMISRSCHHGLTRRLKLGMQFPLSKPA